MARSLIGGFLRDRSGTAILEAAVVLPIFIVIMGGLFDFGRAYSTMSAAQKSLRGAVRYLTLLPSSAVCGWGADNAKNLAVYGDIGTSSGSPVITGWQKTNITVTPTDCSTLSTTPIQMSATVPYNSLMWSIVGLPSSITMNVSYQERWIGQ